VLARLSATSKQPGISVCAQMGMFGSWLHTDSFFLLFNHLITRMEM